jgi:hypothetical protein
MTRTATQGLIMVGGFIALLMVAAAAFVKPNREGMLGAGIGAGLGLVNLAVGYFLTRRTLRQGMKSAMATLAGGFIARLLVLVGLMLLFRRTGAVDPAAFALTVLVFFFVYLGVELLLVERSLGGTRRAA